MDHHTFRAELKRFDRALDLEYSPVKGCWEVVGRDLAGTRYLIYRIPLGQLGPYFRPVLDALYECTPHRQGGADAVERRLRAIEEREEAAWERQVRADLDEAAEETWERWQLAEGERVSVSRPGYTVIDRRVVRES